MMEPQAVPKVLVEKAFGDIKEQLNMRRTFVSSERGLEGKLIVGFIALIYLPYIKKVNAGCRAL